jgi:hypothetical protein
MRLPAREQRVLDQIEMTFQARDPRLTSQFATFARLTAHEAMPRIEELSGRLSRLLKPVVLIPMLAILIVSSVVAGSFTPSRRCSTVPTAKGATYAAAKTNGCNADRMAGSWSQDGR